MLDYDLDNGGYAGPLDEAVAAVHCIHSDILTWLEELAAANPAAAGDTVIGRLNLQACPGQASAGAQLTPLTPAQLSCS